MLQGFIGIVALVLVGLMIPHWLLALLAASLITVSTLERGEESVVGFLFVICWILPQPLTVCAFIYGAVSLFVTQVSSEPEAVVQ